MARRDGVDVDACSYPFLITIVVRFGRMKIIIVLVCVALPEQVARSLWGVVEVGDVDIEQACKALNDEARDDRREQLHFEYVAFLKARHHALLVDGYALVVKRSKNAFQRKRTIQWPRR